MTTTLNINREIAALQRMSIADLRERYETLYNEPTKSGNKPNLIHRIAWRLQANAEGDLPERARKRALELANDADLRLTPPRSRQATVVGRIGPQATNGALAPGSVITKQYRGRLLQVSVLADGFEFDGEKYRSLSAIARAITGTQWNGRLFFGLAAAKGATA